MSHWEPHEAFQPPPLDKEELLARSGQHNRLPLQMSFQKIQVRLDQLWKCKMEKRLDFILLPFSRDDQPWGLHWKLQLRCTGGSKHEGRNSGNISRIWSVTLAATSACSWAGHVLPSSAPCQPGYITDTKFPRKCLIKHSQISIAI